jgi:hypothetical protein
VTSTDETGGNADNRRIPPGGYLELPTIEGPSEITRLWLTFSQPSKQHEKLAIEITWDGAEEPSVRAPIGSFFGAGRNLSAEVENVFFHVAAKESLNCFLPMPFKRSARIRLINDSAEQADAVFYIIEYRRFASERDLPARGFLHARYQQAVPAPAKGPYEVLSTRGPGVFVGSNLQVGVNVYGWWGEGDDIMEVDGRRTQGTGSEDYFGGAWGWGFAPAKGFRFGAPDVQRALDPGGFWSVYRFHAEAPITFRDSFRFALENGYDGPDARQPMPNNYYSTAFYYLEQPEPQPPLPPAEDRIWRSLPLDGPRVGEWFEGELAFASSRIAAYRGARAGQRNHRNELAERYRGASEALLTATKSGTGFVLAHLIPVAGRYRVTLRRTTEPAGLVADLYLNGHLWVSEQSFYAGEHAVVEEELPLISLPGGNAMLEWRVRGMDARAVQPGFFLGVDAVRFDRVPDLEEGASPVAHLPVSAVPPDPQAGIAFRYDLAVATSGEATRSILNRGQLSEPVDWEGSEALRAHRDPTGEIGFAFPASGGRIVVGTKPWEGVGRDVEVTCWIYPEQLERRMQIFHRNMTAGAWLERGHVTFWLRDAEFRLFSVSSPPGLLVAGQWTHLRFLMKDGVAQLYLNGALVREELMDPWAALNPFAGRMLLGNTEEATAPWSGALSQFRLRFPPVDSLKD